MEEWPTIPFRLRSLRLHFRTFFTIRTMQYRRSDDDSMLSFKIKCCLKEKGTHSQNSNTCSLRSTSGDIQVMTKEIKLNEK